MRHGKHALITSIAMLRERCEVDPATHCWHWLGGYSQPKKPRIYTIDFRTLDKRAMSGPLAVYQIAHQEAPPPGAIIFRGCHNWRCLNPAHLRRARGQGEIGAHLRLSGALKGRNKEMWAKALHLAWAAQKVTPPEVVAAIRREPAETTNVQLAARLGMGRSTVSKIRLGRSHVRRAELHQPGE